MNPEEEQGTPLPPDKEQEATLPADKEPAASSTDTPESEEGQEAALPPEAAPDAASAHPPDPGAAPGRRGPSRRVFSWAAAVAAVLVVALITTTLVIGHQAPVAPAANAHATPSPTPKPPHQFGVYGLTSALGATSGFSPISPWAATSTPTPPTSRVFALNAVDGTVRWQHALPNEAGTGEVLAGDVLYVGTTDGSVSAFDTITGKQLWSIRLLNNSSVEQVVNGIVYATSTSKTGGSSSGQSGVYALDASTGQQLWQFTRGSSIDLIADGLVYVGIGFLNLAFKPAPAAAGLVPAYSAGPDAASQGTIYALDATTGVERWHFQAAGSLSVRGVSDGQVYVIGNRPRSSSPFDLFQYTTVYALDTTTGAQRWAYPRQPVIGLSLVGVESGMVYVFDNNSIIPAGSPLQPPSLNTLSALSAGDGSVRWRKEVPDAPLDGLPTPGTIIPDVVFGSSGAMLSNGVIYLGNMTNPVSAYKASDGSLLWSNAKLWKNTGVQGPTVAMVAAGVVYVLNRVSSPDMGLYALDASSGKLLWKQLGKRWSLAGINDGVVYANSSDYGPPITPRGGDNVVLALDASTGAARWTYTLGKEVATIVTG